MAGPVQEGQRAAGQPGRRRLGFGRLLEEQQGGHRLTVHALGLEHFHQVAGQFLDLGRPALFQQQNRFLQKRQGHVVSHS